MRLRWLLCRALPALVILAILAQQPQTQSQLRYQSVKSSVREAAVPPTKLLPEFAPPIPPPAAIPSAASDGEQCNQGPRASMAACQFEHGEVNGEVYANCTVGSVLRRWHVTTQELLFVHLRTLWADDRPRVFIDLGSQAGHGIYRNTSDALIWLQYFNHSGSLVIGVDAFEDYALDLQHRFEAIWPFSAMNEVYKRSIHAAVGTRKHPLNIGGHAAYTNYLCSRTAWLDDFARFDRHGVTDHACRISRQRAGVSNSSLPLPTGNYSFSTDPDQEYLPPSKRIDEIWREDAGGRHVDFLKMDVDSALSELEPELLPLLRARAFSVLVMEIDKCIGERAWRAVERLNCLFWRHGYALFLKVPCAGAPRRDGIPLWSQRASYMPISGRYHARLPTGWGQNPRAPCSMGGRTRWTDCGTQDVLALDLHQPELAKLVTLGNSDCVTSFPADVTAQWSASAALESPRNPPWVPYGTLAGERERGRGDLWGGSKASKQSRPSGGVFARMLTDGTWSCGPMAKPSPRSRRQAASAGLARGGLPSVGPRCD